MIIFQRCIFKSVLQQFYAGNQGPTRRLLRGLPTLNGHRSESSVFGSSFVSRHAPLSVVFPSDLAGGRERTLIAVKPDGVQRRLVGQIIQRFELRGFKLVGLKMLQVSEGLLSQHYNQLTGKPFYPDLVKYMTSGPVVVMVWEGYNAVQTSRAMVGPTNAEDAQAGTVRGDFCIHISRNVIHASDSPEGAQREIQLWFHGQELLNWDCCYRNITCEL